MPDRRLHRPRRLVRNPPPPRLGRRREDRPRQRSVALLPSPPPSPRHQIPHPTAAQRRLPLHQTDVGRTPWGACPSPTKTSWCLARRACVIGTWRSYWAGRESTGWARPWARCGSGSTTGRRCRLHPGDLGWFWRFGAEATAAAVRTWSRDGRILAVGLLDGPGLLRLTIAPDASGTRSWRGSWSRT